MKNAWMSLDRMGTQGMTKDEALKLCLRVLRPIAEDRVYETRWLQEAIEAAEEALNNQHSERKSDI